MNLSTEDFPQRVDNRHADVQIVVADLVGAHDRLEQARGRLFEGLDALRAEAIALLGTEPGAAHPSPKSPLDQRDFFSVPPVQQLEDGASAYDVGLYDHRVRFVVDRTGALSVTMLSPDGTAEPVLINDAPVVTIDFSDARDGRSTRLVARPARDTIAAVPFAGALAEFLGVAATYWNDCANEARSNVLGLHEQNVGVPPRRS